MSLSFKKIKFRKKKSQILCHYIDIRDFDPQFSFNYILLVILKWKILL